MPISAPQLRVMIDGVPVAGAMACEVEETAYFSADRFELTLAIGDQMALFADLNGQANGPPMITIEVATGVFGFANMLTGQIDNIRLDLRDTTATIAGRDLTARLIDAEIAETFANQTSGQIASAIAMAHGLTPKVTATTVPVGQYYELDHARSALGLHSRMGSAWNMLTQLAQLENFVVAVRGTTLSFGPAAVGTPVLLMPRDCIGLTLDCATTIPGMASVKSWNTRNKTVVNESRGSGNATTLVRPNLTAAQAGTLAANHLSVLSQHVTILEATMPGDVTTMPGSAILLGGTQSSLDGLYAIDMVRRSIEARRGFTQTVRGHAVSN